MFPLIVVSTNNASPVANTPPPNVLEGDADTSLSMMRLAVALFFFGPSKIPELGKGIGEGIRNFKSGLKEGQSEAERQ